MVIAEKNRLGSFDKHYDGTSKFEPAPDPATNISGVSGIWDQVTGWISGHQQRKLQEQQIQHEIIRLAGGGQNNWIVPAALGVSAIAVVGVILATR